MEDLRPLLARLRRGAESLDGRELFQFLPLLDLLSRLYHLRQEIGEAERRAPRLEEILSSIEDFSPLRTRLQRSVAPSGELLDSASPALARARQELLASQHHASELLEDLRGRVGEPHREETFVTLREGRYVLSLRAGQRAAMQGLVHGRSQSGQSLLLEPYEAVEANNRVAEAQEEERAETARVLREITESLRARAEAIAAGLTTAGLCDLIRAQALVALELRSEPPAWNTEGRLRIVQARHPILAEAEARGGARVVPLDLELLRDRPVLLISGPNMGGKSVALKTVGLVVLMFRTGMHVPAADGTDLPLVDAVFVDLGDEQSIEGDLSTFAGHLKNVGNVWAKATRDSLVLLDELGGGTDPEEGAALAMAILEGMAERETLTVATTHLSSVKLFAGEQPRMQNGAMDFDAVSLTPAFRLKIGEAGWSRAFEVARRILPGSEFLERAERYRSPLQLRMDRFLAEIDQEKQLLTQQRLRLAEEEGRLREAVARRERHADRLRERLGRLRADRVDALGRLYREAEEYVRNLKSEMEARAQKPPAAALPEIRKAERELAHRGAELRQGRRRPPRGPRLAPERTHAGADAWLSDFAAVVRILRVVEGRAWVEWQGRRIEVPVASLEEVPEEQARSLAPREPTLLIEEPPGEPVGREVDLRGCRADEALEKLDRFLDRAALQKLHQVRIVHGKGTGALKREVEKHLKNHPLVASFRMGELNEGGWGVTVAELGPGAS
jgi:DNA mismatch repair protein MutS2